MQTFLFFLFLFLQSSAIARVRDPWPKPWWEICDRTANYTTNSTYQSNLNTLLTTLTSKTTISGYSNSTAGQIPNQVFGLALCRGDITSDDCQNCLDTADHDALQLCPYNKGAVIGYDYCVLFYSQLLLSATDNTDQQILYYNKNATDMNRLNELVTELMNTIADYAAYNTTKKFATGEIGNFTVEVPIIYGLVQCTPDMIGRECRKCLQQLLDQIPTTELYGKLGGRVIGVRCTMRFESGPFFFGQPAVKLVAVPASAPTPAMTVVPSSSPVLSHPPSAGIFSDTGAMVAEKKTSIGKVLAIAMPAAAVALIILAICSCFLLKRTTTKKIPCENDKDDISSAESILYNSSTIRTATANFDETNKLGQGGFGAVYKGFLPNGHIIAVKKLLTSSNQGLLELKNELLLVAKLQHRNLVRLLGVCIQEEKLLVYEYVPNGSLDTFLFDPIKSQQLQWRTRYKIICGIARGLQYLHEESQVKIVHRDLKASNILLDADMNPKIADFGIAKLFCDDQTQGNTNRVVGTFGYMAPEYAMNGLFSVKSDVFSFGILVLEIVTGRMCSGSSNPEQHQDLLSYTWAKWIKGTIFDIVDQTLGDHVPRSEVLRCIRIGLLCVQENPADRPNMSTVTVMLSSGTISLQSPLKPPFIFGTTTSIVSEHTGKHNYNGGGHAGSPNKLSSRSQNDFSVTEVEAR